MARLAGRLHAAGFGTHLFSYKSRTESLQDAAGALHQFIASLALESMHVLAHSLGGLVVMETLAGQDQLPPGRVVLLGSPVNGSEVARRLASLRIGQILIGRSISTLAAGNKKDAGSRETGVIAGTRSFGLGLLTGNFAGANDGTVAVSETCLTGSTAQLELPVTHTGLLFSPRVAEQAIYFFKSGTFNAEIDDQ
jgi:pimeloyl-ACP methyl ester carboxylesterase